MNRYFKFGFNKIVESSEKVLDPKFIVLFKFLNEKKKKYKTKSELLGAIEELLPALGISENYSLYLLNLYSLNYRQDGNYSTITKDNFIDPRKLPGKSTPNYLAKKYTVAQLPFKGSNLEGYWTKDLNNVPYYIVKSYNWYPIYIFKQGQWYQISDRYSSSTSKQMSGSNPVGWEVEDGILLLTRDEMELLTRKATKQDILDLKLKKLKKNKELFLGKKIKTQPFHPLRWVDEYRGLPTIKIKYKISSIDFSDPKNPIVNVDVHDVLKVEDKKQIPTPENYTKGELKGITPELVEKLIIQKIKHKFSEVIGPRLTWGEDLPETSLVKFKFNHLRQ